MAIPNSTYTELVTTTIDLYRESLTDNVTAHNPLLKRMRQRGNTDAAPGGNVLLENLMYAENSTLALRLAA